MSKAPAVAGAFFMSSSIVAVEWNYYGNSIWFVFMGLGV